MNGSGQGTPSISARESCSYCSVADLKASLSGEQWTSGVKYDALVADLIEEASRLIDEELGWTPCYYAASDLSTVNRYYDTVWGNGMAIDRFMVDAGLVVAVDEEEDGAYVDWTINTDYLTWPYNEQYTTHIVIKDGADKRFVPGQRLLRVTGRVGGYAQPPAQIRRATVITAARWFKRGMQTYQDTGAVVEVGQLTYTKALDPDVKEILRVMPRRVRFG